ncbi:MAG TPA: hypothetical protein VMV69_20790 [Pirellulales bacterium]|nr:hypothetical protein [Pirellulales bacterium]
MTRPMTHTLWKTVWFVMILALGHGNVAWASPFCLVPLPPDPALQRLAPEECLFYYAWNGAATPDAKSQNQTEQLLADVRDGTSNTLMIVEAAADRAVDWTKPDDLAVDVKNPLAGLTGLRPNVFLAAFADGSVHAISEKVSPDVLKALFTRAAGEPIAPGAF